MLVFVYGTLKHDHHNNHYLNKAVYIGQYILQDFKLVTGYGLPAVLPSKGDFVRGEVYKIDNEILKKLDFLESNGTYYVRMNAFARLDVDNDSLQDRAVIVYSGVPKYWCTSEVKDGFKGPDGVYQW
jgi:gamma-glutamylcyclotransferase (GGCT)/AIG2-like uncharacterized protein YtfP